MVYLLLKVISNFTSHLCNHICQIPISSSFSISDSSALALEWFERLLISDKSLSQTGACSISLLLLSWTRDHITLSVASRSVFIIILTHSSNPSSAKHLISLSAIIELFIKLLLKAPVSSEGHHYSKHIVHNHAIKHELQERIRVRECCINATEIN